MTGLSKATYSKALDLHLWSFFKNNLHYSSTSTVLAYFSFLILLFGEHLSKATYSKALYIYSFG